MKQQLGITDKLIPDKNWLVTFISTYAPNDEIFEKSYMPPAIKPKI